MYLELQGKANEDSAYTHISRIITGDKSWIYSYDPETKQQLSEWKSPQSPNAKKAQQVWSSTKSVLIVLFDVKGIVHLEFVSLNTMVNSYFYCDVLKCLRENVRQKRLELWCNQLHCNNTPAHMALKATDCVTNNNMVIIPHPPYSPDLGPYDFALFRKLRVKLNGRWFETVSDIQKDRKLCFTALKKMTSTVFWKLGKEKMMGSLYTFPRSLS
jgi:hypothetical protein